MAIDMKAPGSIAAVVLGSALALGGGALALSTKAKKAEPIAIHFLGDAPHRYAIDAMVKSDGRRVSRTLICAADGTSAHVEGTEPSALVVDDALLAACKQMVTAGAAIADGLQTGVDALDVEAPIKKK